MDQKAPPFNSPHAGCNQAAETLQKSAQEGTLSAFLITAFYAPYFVERHPEIGNESGFGAFFGSSDHLVECSLHSIKILGGILPPQQRIQLAQRIVNILTVHPQTPN